MSSGAGNDGPGGDGPSARGVLIWGISTDGCMFTPTGVRLCDPKDAGRPWTAPLCAVVNEDTGRLMMFPCR